MYVARNKLSLDASECVDLYSALSLRTQNALDALTREQVRFK